MTPEQRTAICGRCTLPLCNEQSKACLIQIERRGKDVNRASRRRRHPSIAAETQEERHRRQVFSRGVLELATFKKISPSTMDEIMEIVGKGDE